MHPWIKQCVLKSAYQTGLLGCARKATQASFRILSYHGVEEGLSPVVNFDGFMVEPARFRQQLERLARHYTIVPLSLLTEHLLEGRPPPYGAVALTFDDGYENYATTVAPILMEFGFPATFFLTTGFLDGTDYPWWFSLRHFMAETHTLPPMEPGQNTIQTPSVQQRCQAIQIAEAQLKDIPRCKREENMRAMEMPLSAPRPAMLDWEKTRKLVRQGFEVGPHTVHHVSMGHEKGATIAQEIAESQHTLQRECPKAGTCFSFPYGQEQHCSKDIEAIFAQSGITSAVTDQGGFNTLESNPFALHRFAITGNHSADALDAVISGFRGGAWRR